MIQKVTSKHQSGEQTHVIHKSSMHRIYSPPNSRFPPLTSTYYFCVSEGFFSSQRLAIVQLNSASYLRIYHVDKEEYWSIIYYISKTQTK